MVECLLSKLKDLRSNPQHPCKESGVVWFTSILSTGDVEIRNRWLSGVHWLARVDESMNSGYSEKPSRLQGCETVGNTHHWSLVFILTCTYLYIHLCAHVYTSIATQTYITYITYIHTHTYAHKHTHTHRYPYRYKHTQMHTHKHTHTDTNTHAHKQRKTGGMPHQIVSYQQSMTLRESTWEVLS